MSAAVTLDGSTGVVHLRTGSDGPGGHLAFERTGPADAPVVLVLGGISADRHLAATPARPRRGWWDEQVGSGRALDPDRLALLGVDYLAGPGASAPARWLGALEGFPVTPARQADALVRVLDALGVGRAYAVIGASYGGMVALSFAERHPKRLERLAVLCAAHAPHAMATALRSLQRRAVRLARRHGDPAGGLALARGLAMTSYRTAGEFASRFPGAPRWAPDGVRFAVDDYLDARGSAFADAFDADAFLALSESLDLHRVDPAAVRTPTWVLASRSDPLVPLWQTRELVAGLGGPVSCTEIPSRWGHDAFLKDTAPVGRFLRRALAGPLPGRSRPAAAEPGPSRDGARAASRVRPGRTA
jgi:homoserine O-acetyltransferase